MKNEYDNQQTDKPKNELNVNDEEAAMEFPPKQFEEPKDKEAIQINVNHHAESGRILIAFSREVNLIALTPQETMGFCGAIAKHIKLMQDEKEPRIKIANEDSLSAIDNQRSMLNQKNHSSGKSRSNRHNRRKMN